MTVARKFWEMPYEEDLLKNRYFYLEILQCNVGMEEVFKIYVKVLFLPTAHKKFRKNSKSSKLVRNHCWAQKKFKNAYSGSEILIRTTSELYSELNEFEFLNYNGNFKWSSTLWQKSTWTFWELFLNFLCTVGELYNYLVNIFIEFQWQTPKIFFISPSKAHKNSLS